MNLLRLRLGLSSRSRGRSRSRRGRGRRRGRRRRRRTSSRRASSRRSRLHRLHIFRQLHQRGHHVLQPLLHRLLGILLHLDQRLVHLLQLLTERLTHPFANLALHLLDAILQALHRVVELGAHQLLLKLLRRDVTRRLLLQRPHVALQPAPRDVQRLAQVPVKRLGFKLTLGDFIAQALA